MPTDLGLPRYHKYSETEDGTKLVEMGEFIGSTEGKYGAQHNFIELRTGQQVVLNKSGGLDWRIEQGHITEGGVYDVYFEGKELLTKGTFAGKEANRFRIAKYGDAEIVEAGVRRPETRVPKPTATTAVKAPEPKEVSDSLDELS